jgi:replicative DNA helicase
MSEPSHDIAAERAVIGAVLYSAGRQLDDLQLTAEDFFHPPHAELWDLIGQMRAAGDPIETTAVLARSERKTIHTPVLADCVAAATPSAGFYAEQLRGHTARRRILMAGVRLQQLAESEGDRDVAELNELARGLVDEQTQTGELHRGTVSLLDALVAGFERWGVPDTNVLPTGWLDLDDKLNGGLRPGHLTVIGVAAIRGRARDLTRRPRGLGLVIVDYLQLVTPTDRRAPREQQVASISRGLKLMAKDLQVPVVALSQVNRGPTGRDNKRPTMSDLRESGAIEADADEIWLLHRDEDRPGELEVNVAKNRHGTTGLVELGWHPYTARITNITYQGEAIPA